jgi:hypothetical protein
MPVGKLEVSAATTNELRLGDAAVAAGQEVWPRHLRVIFALGAGAICWAVPLLVLYLFFKS